MNRNDTKNESEEFEEVIDEDYDLSSYEEEDEEDDFDNEDENESDEDDGGTSQGKMLFALALLSLIVAAGGGYLAYSFVNESKVSSVTADDIAGVIEQSLQEVAPNDQVAYNNEIVPPLADEQPVRAGASEPVDGIDSQNKEAVGQANSIDDEIEQTLTEINSNQPQAPQAVPGMHSSEKALPERSPPLSREVEITEKEITQQKVVDQTTKSEGLTRAPSPSVVPSDEAGPAEPIDVAKVKQALEEEYQEKKVTLVKEKKFEGKDSREPLPQVKKQVSEVQQQKEIVKPNPPLGGVFNNYYLQISSESSKASAEVLAKSLESKGFLNEVQEAVVGGRTYYRVLSGPYTKQEASQLVGTVKKTLGRTESPFVKQKN